MPIKGRTPRWWLVPGDVEAGHVVLGLLAVVLASRAAFFAVEFRLVEGRAGGGGRVARNAAAFRLDFLTRLARRPFAGGIAASGEGRGDVDTEDESTDDRCE